MKTALVTGINKGLGKELFSQLIARGYFVYGLLRNEAYYEQLQGQQLPNATLILADIASDECKEKIRLVVKDKPIDLLINNAGIGGEGMSLDKADTTEIMDLLQVHCLGALRVVQALKDNLLEASSPVVLNLSSRLGSLSRQYDGTFSNLQSSYAYRIAKAAQNMLTMCLRAELGSRIEFVSITPGKLLTQLAQKDANLSPAEGAERIIRFWEEGRFKAQNGILQVPDNLTAW